MTVCAWDAHTEEGRTLRAQWYYDSFSGLIPVKVLAIIGTSGIASTAQRCKLEVTASKGPFHKDEQLECFGLHLVPWQAVRRSRYATHIRPYELMITTQEASC